MEYAQYKNYILLLIIINTHEVATKVSFRHRVKIVFKLNTPANVNPPRPLFREMLGIGFR